MQARPLGPRVNCAPLKLHFSVRVMAVAAQAGRADAGIHWWRKASEGMCLARKEVRLATLSVTTTIRRAESARAVWWVQWSDPGEPPVGATVAPHPLWQDLAGDIGLGCHRSDEAPIQPRGNNRRRPCGLTSFLGGISSAQPFCQAGRSGTACPIQTPAPPLALTLQRHHHNSQQPASYRRTTNTIVYRQNFPSILHEITSQTGTHPSIPSTNAPILNRFPPVHAPDVY